VNTVTATSTLDRRGKTITTYVAFDAAARLEAMGEGEILELLTEDTDPFEPDLRAWCRAAGHTLVESERTTRGRRFLIEKGTPVAKDTTMAMVVSVDGLEELLSPLGFALAAALEGVDVHLFFQGPGVRVLANGFRPKLQGWARPFSRMAAAGMTRTGHIPAQDKLRQLRTLGAHVYACGPSMEHFKVDRSDLIFDDVSLVAYLTFMAVMERADVTLYL